MKKLLTDEQMLKIVEKAREMFEHEGTLEIDECEGRDLKDQISVNEYTRASIKKNGGAYVKAWVWVEFKKMDI